MDNFNSIAKPKKQKEFKVSVDLIKIWDWIKGRKRKKFRQWLADNRKRRRQNLHYKPITEAELYEREEAGQEHSVVS